MISESEIPETYVNIRNIWLRNINRCGEAISRKAKPDTNISGNIEQIGERMVVDTITNLYYSLVDYGEALIKTEATDYKEQIDRFIIDCSMKKYDRIIKKEKSKPYSEIADKAKQDIENRTPDLTIQADNYEILYDKILFILNKYGMLFEQLPEGYTNVTMEDYQGD